jgi:anti-sigma B factor antagonist
MNLSIEVRELDHAIVLELAGRFSVPELSLRQLVWELIQRGERNFVINLANVSYLDNWGLGQLCWIYTTLREHGGEMRLLKPTSRIKKLLSMTKLDTVFQSCESESEAVAFMELRPAVSA